MAYEQHTQAGKDNVARCAIVTLSDTRTEATDASGKKIRELLTGAGHQVSGYRIVRDEPSEFEPALVSMLNDPDIDAILTNGGTGVSKRDQTIAVVEKHLDQTLPGFGELFRMLSWEQIGSGAMLSRAIGGIAKGKVVFAMPGSTKAPMITPTSAVDTPRPPLVAGLSFRNKGKVRVTIASPKR